jgi:hypothetical protein
MYETTRMWVSFSSNLGRLSSLRLAVVPVRAPEKTGQQETKATGFCVAQKTVQATVQPSGISRLSTDPDLPLRKPYVMCVGRRVVKHDLGTFREVLRARVRFCGYPWRFATLWFPGYPPPESLPVKSVAREGLLSEATDRYTVNVSLSRTSHNPGVFCLASLPPSTGLRGCAKARV